MHALKECVIARLAGEWVRTSFNGEFRLYVGLAGVDEDELDVEEWELFLTHAWAMLGARNKWVMSGLADAAEVSAYAQRVCKEPREAVELPRRRGSGQRRCVREA